MQLFKQRANPSLAISIQKKFWGVSVLIFLGVLLLVYFSYSIFSSSLLEERKSQSKHLSTAVMGVVKHYHALSARGILSESTAKRQALEAVKYATYNETGHFWINDGNGALLMHPYSVNKVNSNLLNSTDSSWFYYMREIVKTAKSGGGWVHHEWPKPNSDEFYEKLSYVHYFAPWNWVLGTGVYMDDVEESIFNAILKESLLLFLVFLIFFISTLACFNIFASELEALAIRDSLTGLYTKRYLTETTPLIMRKASRNSGKTLSVAFLDIDHFKMVNDQYGHKTGDIVLKTLGKVIKSDTRPHDYCIRYGGEEIVVIGLFDDFNTSVKVIDRIRHKFEKLKFKHKNQIFSVTLSAGITNYNPDSDGCLEDTLVRADDLLYQSKNNGRNQITSQIVDHMSETSPEHQYS